MLNTQKEKTIKSTKKKILISNDSEMARREAGKEKSKLIGLCCCIYDSSHQTYQRRLLTSQNNRPSDD